LHQVVDLYSSALHLHHVGHRPTIDYQVNLPCLLSGLFFRNRLVIYISNSPDFNCTALREGYASRQRQLPRIQMRQIRVVLEDENKSLYIQIDVNYLNHNFLRHVNK
jgi:hypothetical protein